MANHQDPRVIAAQAERDLNSHAAKVGHSNEAGSRGKTSASDSTTESGIDLNATAKFPGATATYGSAASGAGDNREIPVEEGGDVKSGTGRPTKALDFEGLGGPEDKTRAYAAEFGGEDDVRDNIRQAGNTVRPAGSASAGDGPLRTDDVGRSGAGIRN